MKKREKVPLYFESGIVLDNQLIFVSRDFNAIFSLNFSNREVDIIGSLPEEPIWKDRLCGKILNWKNYLIFVPLCAKKIWMWDLKTKEWYGIKIKNEEIPYKFFDAVLYDNKIYMMGFFYPVVVRVNLEKETIRYFEGSLGEENNSVYGGIQGVVKEKRIFFPFWSSGRVLQFNMETESYSWHELCCDVEGFMSINYEEENFWLVSRKGKKIIKWNGLEKLEIFNFTEENQKLEKDDLFLENGILLPVLPSNSEKIIFKIINGRIYHQKSKESLILCKNLNNEDGVIVNEKGEIWVGCKKIEKYSCEMSKDKIINFLCKHSERMGESLENMKQLENVCFDLEVLLKFLIKRKQNKISINSNNNIGYGIFKRINNR